MAYMAYPIIAFHPLFSSPKKFQLEFPKADYQYRQQKQSCENISDSIRLGMCTANKASWASRHKFILELAPYLAIIIAPDLRPVNVQVMKPNEVAVLMRIVRVLSSFGFKLVQERRITGGFTYRLDPYILLMIVLLILL